MTGYTKLFGSIVASTIWREPHTVRIVWITMLAMANKSGIVEASVPGLADLSRVTLHECIQALVALESPDEYSRTPDHEGRRIEPADGGWRILNHAKYRAKMGVDERREYLRVKQAEHRSKRKASTNVNKRSGSSTRSTHAEAQSDAEAEALKEKTSSAAPSGPHAVFIELWTKGYPEHHGGETYVFQGGRDGKAVKELLASSKRTPEDLLKFAIGAWKNPAGFNCQKAASISGFASKFNDISNELRTLKNGTTPSRISESDRDRSRTGIESSAGTALKLL